ncbi:helix-turn-helix transcriptional regulator [bacterium]|nr:helix-turn-helix transcriptional regulator [bacterium]
MSNKPTKKDKDHLIVKEDSVFLRRNGKDYNFIPAKSHTTLTTGEVIKTLRELKEWTQGELAKKSGINSNNISLIEHDRVKIGKYRSIALAEAFGVHPAIIMFPEYGTGSLGKAA